MALAMANWACDCPCSGSLAVSCCVCAQCSCLVVTPQVWGLRLPPRAGTSSICSPCSDASVRSPSPVDGVLILCSHFRGSTSGGGSCACLPSHGNLPRSHLATPCTQGTNASRVRHSGHGSPRLASGFDAGVLWRSAQTGNAPPRSCTSRLEG